MNSSIHTFCWGLVWVAGGMLTARGDTHCEVQVNPKRADTCGTNQEDWSVVVGKWEWEMKLGSSGGKAQLEVREEAGKLTGFLTGPDGEKVRVKDISLIGDKFRVGMQRKKGLITIHLKLSGTVQGDEIRGTYAAQAGLIKKNGKWIAKRVQSR